MGQSQFSFTHQLKTLYRYKWTIILVALVSGITAFILTFMRSPMYEATARVMVTSGEQRLAAISSTISGGLELTYLQDIGSQIEVMKSHAVLENAILKIDPDMTSKPDELQTKINNLEAALSIDQVDSTNLVTITVVAADRNLALQKADAVAEAYVNYVHMTTKSTIEQALQETTEQLEELQKANIELSTNPMLYHITTKVNYAINSLQIAAEKLHLIGDDSNTESVESSGTVLAASQLNLVSQRIKANALEANAISLLTSALNPVDDEDDYTDRSSEIAVIESRVRALTTRLSNLASDINSAYQAETHPETKEQLHSVEEQIIVARATGEAVLAQVISLYNIQEQYISARKVTGDGQISLAEVSTAKEADANTLNRLIQHTSILADTMESTSEQVKDISAIASTTDPELWRFTVLGTRTDSVISSLQAIITNLQPSSTEGDNLITRQDLSEMEIQAQTISISLSNVSSELTNIQSEDFETQISNDLMSIQESITVVRNTIQDLDEQIAGLSETGGDVSYAALDNMRQELQLALLSGDTGGTMVVDSAVVLASSDVFGRYRGVLLAVIAGLLLGAVGVLTYRYVDRTVRDASQVKEQTAIPYLASVGSMNSNNNESVSVLDDVVLEHLESFRLIRTNLGLDSAQGKILLVSSPEVGEGKTTIAANLARVVALQDRKTLLIDCNLRSPGVGKIFGLSKLEGLSDFLKSENKKIDDYLAEADGIDIIQGGKPSLISAELLSSSRFKSLLEKARKDYDVIIIDSASILEVTDVRIIAKNVDGVIMVLKNNTSKIDLVRESKQALETTGVRIEGFVLNQTATSGK